jgi:hypothetical protein
MSFLRVKHIGQADPSENGMNQTVVRSARHFITFNNIQSHPITPNNISCPIPVSVHFTAAGLSAQMASIVALGKYTFVAKNVIMFQ